MFVFTMHDYSEQQLGIQWGPGFAEVIGLSSLWGLTSVKTSVNKLIEKVTSTGVAEHGRYQQQPPV